MILGSNFCLSLYDSERLDCQLTYKEVRTHRPLQEERLLRRGYTLGSKLGCGTFGDVYSVEQADKKYAVKISVVPSGRSLFDSCFEAFVMTLGRDCENIVSLIDCFLVEGIFEQQRITLAYFIMPQSDCTLHYYSHRNGPLNEDEVKPLFYHISNGLGFLHSKGIAHRDIKLQNILVDIVQDRLLVKLADFGVSRLAKRSGEPVDLFKKAVGTLSYMAPEILDAFLKSKQDMKKKIIEWNAFPADCWAVGVCFFLTVTTQTPFDTSPVQKVDRIKYGTALLAKQQLRDYRKVAGLQKLSHHARNIIQKLLEPNISERYDIFNVLESCWFKSQI